MKMNFKITNITCEACVKMCKMALTNLPGIKNVQMEKDGLTTIESDRDNVWEEVKNALTQVNKQAVLIK